MAKGIKIEAAVWDRIYPRWCDPQNRETKQQLAASENISYFALHMHAAEAKWPARTSMVIVRSRGARSAPAPRPIGTPYQWKPGERICRRCHGRTMTDPSRCCGAPSDLSPKSPPA